MKSVLVLGAFGVFLLPTLHPMFGQSINSGTVIGTVHDSSGGLLPTPAWKSAIQSRDTGETTVTDSNGAFRFNAVPFNAYALTGTHQGFTAAKQNVDVRSTVPLTANLVLPVAGVNTEVTVEGKRRGCRNRAYGPQRRGLVNAPKAAHHGGRCGPQRSPGHLGDCDEVFDGIVADIGAYGRCPNEWIVGLFPIENSES